MISLGKFPTNVIRHNVPVHNPRIPSNSQFRLSTGLQYNGADVGDLRTGLCCAAQKTKKKGTLSVVEMEGPGEFEDDFDGGFEDGDDEIVIPLKNMKEWLDNRPRGFGEGKVYDTSVEDKLVKEIEQSRQAQLANVNKLKDKDSRVNVKPSTKIGRQDKGISHIEKGFRVRLTNLPKKKNIHRDLRQAFDGVAGILSITPVVSGNEKTRDPVCKGLAFVDFKHLEEAQRFVQNFSGISVNFGKVEKQIKCEMIDTNLPKSAPANLDGDLDAAVELHDVLDPSAVSVPNESDDADEMSFLEDVESDGAPTTSREQELERQEESATRPSPSKKVRELKTKNKAEAKTRKDKVPKQNVALGSAKRLKIREQTLLTGVFSKYGANAAVEEQSR